MSQVQRLQSDINCWQVRYEALEKQYASKLAAELEQNKKDKSVKDINGQNVFQ